MSRIQLQSIRRGFNVCLRSGCVGVFETWADEHGAQTAALVGGFDREDVRGPMEYKQIVELQR